MAVKKSAKTIEKLNLENVGEVVAGDELSHPQFGSGIVEEIFEYDDGTNTIRLNFTEYGSKAFVPEYANLSTPDRPLENNKEKSFMGKLLNAIRGKNT